MFLRYFRKYSEFISMKNWFEAIFEIEHNKQNAEKMFTFLKKKLSSKRFFCYLVGESFGFLTFL